jgi:hypothetical protein
VGGGMRWQVAGSMPVSEEGLLSITLQLMRQTDASALWNSNKF